LPLSIDYHGASDQLREKVQREEAGEIGEKRSEKLSEQNNYPKINGNTNRSVRLKMD
jgi:hypothetical protein